MFPVSKLKIACVATVFSCLAATALAEPNPEYQSWSKYKPGATVKIKGTSEAMGQKTEQTVTTKLVEITPEKAVVESSVSMNVMGQTMNQPAQKRDVPAEIKVDSAKPNDPNAQMQKMIKDAKTGEDTVTVAGKSYKCTTREMAGDQNGMKTTTKTWNTPDVPGGMVKIEVNTSGAMTSKSTMELVEFSDGK